MFKLQSRALECKVKLLSPSTLAIEWTQYLALIKPQPVPLSTGRLSFTNMNLSKVRHPYSLILSFTFSVETGILGMLGN